MALNSNPELSDLKNLKGKKKLLVIILLIIGLICFCFFIVLYFFIPYYEQIQGAYYYSNYLLIGTILMVIRFVVLFNLVYILFRKWISHEEPHYSDIPFLLGLFFYIFIYGKAIDLVGYTVITISRYIGVFSELFLLNLTKFREALGIVDMLPIILIGIYFYFFRRSLGRQDFRKEKIARKNTLIFSIVYIFSMFIIIFLLQEVKYLTFIVGIISLIGFGFLIWVFVIAFKGKILPDINSLIISIGFILMLICNVLFPVFINIFLGGSKIGEAFAFFIVEGGSLIATIIILIGLKTKAHYK